MEELIKRLEAATANDAQELSAEVAKAVGTYGLTDNRWPTYPPYCESLDAALTLARSRKEAMIMLSVAFHAVGDAITYDNADSPADLWPAIQAALIEALKARTEDSA